MHAHGPDITGARFEPAKSFLALDHIADDLQKPFSTGSINHLPLNDITTTIETNLLALLPDVGEEEQPETHLTGAKSGG